jgi:hypothetical protein
MRTPADLIKDLEQLGEKTVRTKFLDGDYGHSESGNIIYGHVKEWLSSKESERAEARAEETRRISIWAIVIAIIATLLSVAVPITIAWIQRK